MTNRVVAEEIVDMGKIRILYVCGGPLDFGGITTWIYNYLAMLDTNSIEVEIACYGLEKGVRENDFEILGIKIHHVPYLGKKPIKNYKKLRNLMKNGKYDIIHSHLEAMNSYALWIADKCKVPVRISHSHGTNHYSGGAIKLRIHDFLKQNVTKYSTINLACSEAAGKWLYGEQSFKVVHNAIDYKRFEYDTQTRKTKRDQYGIAEETFVVGTIGHLSSIKNQSFLIDVIASIANDNYALYIVGEGEEKERLIKKISEKKLEDRVVIVPPSDNVEEYYQIFDVYALPSLHEGLPLTAIEAQVAGLPLVVSEGVPKDVALSKKVKRLSLEQELWKEEIISLYDNNRAEDNGMSDAYDIRNCVSLLEEIYENACR